MTGSVFRKTAGDREQAGEVPGAGTAGTGTPGRLAPLLPGGEPVESLLRRAQFFTAGTPSGDYREVHRRGGRGAEEFYHERWRHDKVVRSTHGVNCTGSCSWKIYVKDGIITWETQQTDYPSTGPDMPEYEPRGCPRGASFSWYTYSPSRVRFPYVRGPLLQMWREARARLGDPVEAWAEVTGGIGEHSPAVRAAATRRLGHLGVLVDAERNDGTQHDADISHAQASARTLVVTAREDLQSPGRSAAFWPPASDRPSRHRTGASQSGTLGLGSSVQAGTAVKRMPPQGSQEG